jgi:catechol 2,3-dioxygenase
VQVGHVHSKVADLDRSLAFYCGVLGFELMQCFGSQAAFISAGGYHHHIGLNTWESAGGSPPPPGRTGLYLRDPDQNGVELYWDRPRDVWPQTDDGRLAMFTRPLDLRRLLAEPVS